MAEEAKDSELRGEADDRVRAIRLRDETEKMLHSAVNITEVATEMTKRTKTGEKTVNHLRRLSVGSRRALEALGATGQEFSRLAAQTALAGLRNLEAFAPADDVVFNSLKHDYGKLLHTLHYSDASQEKKIESHPSPLNLEEIRERITAIEQLQKSSQRGFQHPPSSSTPPHSRPPSDFDEKYPVLQPRGSLIDLSHITNLQTVPEDAFVSSRHPARCSSLCSLKSMRRLMKTLQRAEVGEVGERGEERKCDKELVPSRLSSGVNVRLGDITEELQPE